MDDKNLLVRLCTIRGKKSPLWATFLDKSKRSLLGFSVVLIVPNSIFLFEPCFSRSTLTLVTFFREPPLRYLMRVEESGSKCRWTQTSNLDSMAGISVFRLAKLVFNFTKTS